MCYPPMAELVAYPALLCSVSSMLSPVTQMRLQHDMSVTCNLYVGVTHFGKMDIRSRDLYPKHAKA